MKVERKEIEPDSGFLHGKGMPEVRRLRLLVDGVVAGEASFAKRDGVESWLVRPAGFPDFVRDPGSRLMRKPATRTIALGRLQEAHAAAGDSMDVKGVRLVCVGPLHVVPPKDNFEAGHKVYLGHDGSPFELRIALREVVREDFPALLGWDCYADRRDGRPIFVTGGSSPQDAAEAALALRWAPANALEEAADERSIASKALVGYGSELDLSRPESIPSPLRHVEGETGAFQVGPLPGEVLYVVEPVEAGWDVVGRDGRRFMQGVSRQSAFGFLGIQEAPEPDEPESSPAP